MTTHPQNVRAFWCEPSGLERIFLRRYVSGSDDCRGGSYHQARVFYSDEPEDLRPDVPRDHANWPTKCDNCGQPFSDADPRQLFPETIYIRTDTGQQILRSENAPGMMWDATWMSRKGSDGRSVYVILPNGREWAIDGRARNCTMPEDNEHRCWVRHGEPPEITVDKNGHSCAAGAGSIQAADYHGFLRNGVFAP